MGSHPAQNPPPLEDGDWRAWSWFHENCTLADRELGLMAENFKGLDLRGGQRRLFKLKLGEIIAMYKRIEAEKMEQAAKGRS